MTAATPSNLHTHITDKGNDGNYLSVSDYDYPLPDELIARYPLSERSSSRLLYVPDQHPIQDKQFTDLPSLLHAGDLLVLNDTKVMKARLFGKKDTGGHIEVLIERVVSKLTDQNLPDLKSDSQYPHVCLCHIKASNAPKIGQEIFLAENHMQGKVLARQNNLFVVGFTQPIYANMQRYGELPIPPYFDRRADDNDNQRYQTVFCNPNNEASVAAPTASLHFDNPMLQTLKNKGIDTAFVTLNVGAGTFAPVKTNNLLEHTMHREYGCLPVSTIKKIQQTKAQGNQVIAVGTTVTRLLETAWLQPKFDHTNGWQGDTDIFIYPSFEFKVVDRLLTNFHLPKSTLLMLVSAFSGKSKIEQAYQHAIEQRYRFFSYGDVMLLDKIT